MFFRRKKNDEGKPRGLNQKNRQVSAPEPPCSNGERNDGMDTLWYTKPSTGQIANATRRNTDPPRGFEPPPCRELDPSASNVPQTPLLRSPQKQVAGRTTAKVGTTNQPHSSRHAKGASLVNPLDVSSGYHANESAGKHHQPHHHSRHITGAPAVQPVAVSSSHQAQKSAGRHHHHHYPNQPVPRQPHTTAQEHSNRRSVPHEEADGMERRRHAIPRGAADLLALIRAGDEWNASMRLVEEDPKCVRLKDSVTLHGQPTVAYPLHAAVCVNPPLVFVEKLISAFPKAVEVGDDHCGRVPLHWACMSGTPVPVLEKLVRMFPKACTTTDKSHGRIPLHYLCMYATSIQQFSPLLSQAESREISQKDKSGQSPFDLAQSSSNPLKLEILALLKKRNPVSMNNNLHPGRSGILNNLAGAMGSIYRGPPKGETHVTPTEWESPDVPNNSTTPHSNVGQAGPPPTTTRHSVLKPAPNDGFYIDRRHNMKLSAEVTTSSNSSGLSAEDPGPQTSTRKEIPGVRAMTRNQSWGQSNPEPSYEEYHPHNPMSNWYGDMNDDMPVDPLSRTAAKSEFRQHTQTAAPAPTKTAPPVKARQEQPHQKKKPVTASSMPKEPSLSSSGTDSQQEYMKRYAEKMKQFSPEKKKKGQSPPVASSRPDELAAKKEGQSLLNDMNASIRNLKVQLKRHCQAVHEKDSQVQDLDSQLGQMDGKEQQLIQELVGAQTSADKLQESLLRKRSRLDDVRQQILLLQQEVYREEASMESMERKFSAYEANATAVQDKLKAHREQQGDLGVIRQGLKDEREKVRREMTNCESELKSMEAIQNMAMGGEDNF